MLPIIQASFGPRVCKVDKEDKAKEDEYCGADERNVISPEHKETVRNEEREAKEDKPEEDFRTPPTAYF